jgi:hypothetical protein
MLTGARRFTICPVQRGLAVLVFNAGPFEGFDSADASSHNPIVRMDIDLEILYELPAAIVGGGVKVSLTADENQPSHRGVNINKPETLSLTTSRDVVLVSFDPCAPISDLPDSMGELSRWVALLGEKWCQGAFNLYSLPLKAKGMALTDHEICNKLRAKPLLRNYPAPVTTPKVLDKEIWVAFKESL